MKYVTSLRSLCLAVASVFLLGGCGLLASSKPKPVPLAELKDNVLSVLWSNNVGKSQGYLLQPGLLDRVIYAGSFDDGIKVINPDRGLDIRRLVPKSELTGGVGVGEGIVVIGGKNGEIQAYDTQGQSLWQNQLNGEILAAPIVAANVIVARTADGRVFGLDKADGKRKWVYQKPTPALTLRTNGGAAIAKGVAYLGFAGGKMVAIELESGKALWEGALSTPRGATELERVADIAGTPVVDGNMVCAAAYQGRSGCLELATGNVIWSREISSPSGVAVDAKNLYLSDTQGAIFALDKNSGSTVWKQEKLMRREPGTPLLFKGYLLAGDGTGMVHALSLENGELVGRAEADSAGTFAFINSLTGRSATDGNAAWMLANTGDIAVVQTTKGRVVGLTVR